MKKVKRAYKVLLYLSVFCFMFLGIELYANAEGTEDYIVRRNTIVEYTGTEENVVVPSEIDGRIITTIGDHAFFENTDIETVVLPDTIKNIEPWAFGYCDNLSSISLPDGLEKIDSSAFYLCRRLVSVSIPQSTSFIGTHCFRGCVSLESVDLPSSISSIQYRTFSNCISLSTIELPDSIRTLDREAFYQSGLKQIGLNEGLVKIGENCFYECDGLSEISFPSTVELIEAGAFEGTSLTGALLLPQSLKTVGANAFKNLKEVTSVSLGNVERIEEEAFFGDSAIHFISLPEGLSFIGDGAFGDCFHLSYVSNRSLLSVSLQSDDNGCIAKYAIALDNGDNEYTITEKNGFYFLNADKIYLIDADPKIGTIKLPENVDGHAYEIGQYSFYGNRSVGFLSIPEGVEKIGAYAFANSDTLLHIDLPSTLQSIGYNAFNNCENLRYVGFGGESEDFEAIKIEDGNEALRENLTFLEETDNADVIGEDTNDNSLSFRLLKFLANNIFFINFLLTLFWGVLLLYSYKGDDEAEKKKRKILFIIIVCIQWILISGLRADFVGADTFNYMEIFDKHINWSWNKVFLSLKNNYLKSVASGSDEYEPGYILLEKVISVFTANHIAYKFIIAIIWMAALGRYLYLNSEDPCLSFVIYSGLFYNMFSLTGYRQVVSAAIGVLLAFEFIKKRNFKAFLITVLIAAMFHRSTLIIIPFYFLARKKITTNYILTLVGIVGVTVAFRNQIFNYIKVIAGYEEYTGTYGFAQGTFVIILTLLTIVLVSYRDRVLQHNEDAIIYYNGLVLTWFMVPMAMVSPTSMRLVYDFGFVLLLIVPAYVESMTIKTNKLIIRVVIFVIFGYFVLTRTPEYLFFWQV